jgi:NAD(P)H dehydrogenase (quinone)
MQQRAAAEFQRKKGAEVMMKISVILAHPDKTSFNHAVAATAIEKLKQNGHEVVFHDLYEEEFDPLLTAEEIPRGVVLPFEVEKHCTEISAADGVVIIHPNWWGQPPAILKGWVDRVIRPGVAYEFLENDKGEGVPCGLLKATSAVVFNTSNTETEREKNIFGDPLETIWKNCIFGLCGVKSFYRRMFNIVVVSSEEQRKEWLEEVRQTIDTYFPGTSNY